MMDMNPIHTNVNDNFSKYDTFLTPIPQHLEVFIRNFFIINGRDLSHSIHINFNVTAQKRSLLLRCNVENVTFQFLFMIHCQMNWYLHFPILDFNLCHRMAT